MQLFVMPINQTKLQVNSRKRKKDGKRGDLSCALVKGVVHFKK